MFAARILKKKQTEQAGEEKREKQKGKAMELSSEGRQVKKGPEEPEEQTNNQNTEAKDSWPVNCRKLTLGLKPQWRRQD
jgi:hypothetical protein